jgi:DeoR family transcriptional regulator of aga operon
MIMNDMASPAERQRDILDLLAQHRRISIASICEVFSVSESTARRDLENLAEQGQLERVHGGAISLRRSPPELPILMRERELLDEKIRIGRAAAGLVQNGETVFLGSGTTVLEVARNLRQHKNLSVISNSLPVLNTLVGLPDISVIVLGGVLRDSELSFIGHITEQALAEINADRVIMGIRAINLENGLTNDYLPETMTDRAILHAGRQVVIVADHTKCGMVSTAFVAPLTSIHTLVTDDKVDAGFVDSLRSHGIDVIVV